MDKGKDSVDRVSRPLVVDLDGTLTPVDTLHEAALRYFRAAPLAAPLHMLGWLRAGKPVLKRELAHATPLDPATLPYDDTVLAAIRAARADGRRVVLCTASDRASAEAIAAHLGLFDEVMASDGRVNLAGPDKASALVERFGTRGFDYIGNSSADLAVWAEAQRALVINAPEALAREAEDRAPEIERMAGRQAGLRDWLRAARLHQWVKNLLIFVPVLAAHRYDEPALLAQMLLAFLAFGLLSSATYFLNDLLDLEADRAHAAKRHRPFASGRIPAAQAALVTPLMFLGALALAALNGAGFVLTALIYLAVSTLYSVQLKQVPLLDCMLLAGLFTLRVIAGAVAMDQGLSYWLLLFSVFLFLSLAYLKRYVELAQSRPKGELKGRRYRSEDVPIVMGLGLGAGYAATVVLGLYIHSDAAIDLYGNRYFVSFSLPVLIYWVSWMWMQASRGEMHHDPLLHAVRSRHSQITGALFLAIFFAASHVPG
ncbi:UbiA family prenyltransferase [Litorisediminicola beolgyonensis]|uniref:UbiA family prenyltransferase n=1 Tax=Litorisediminicola beolgyonensis TaxID=1173614 RepID=A0ABW3ZDP1_9RHOB